jgi:hypothetical protein
MVIRTTLGAALAAVAFVRRISSKVWHSLNEARMFNFECWI